MAITFGNVANTDFTYTEIGTGSWGSNTDNHNAMAKPSAASAAGLLVWFAGISDPDGTNGFVDFNPSLFNVSGEVEQADIFQAQSTTLSKLVCLTAPLTGSEANWNAVADTGPVNVWTTKLGLYITGHNATTPIRASATNYGTGTTVTFPDTASVNDGDMVLRVFVTPNSAGSTATFTGTSGIDTTIVSDTNSGDYLNSFLAGYSIKSGAGAPGTASLTLGQSREWVAMTVVVAVDGVAPVTKLKLLAHSSAASATGVAGVVFAAPTGGAITGAEIGEFTGAAFEASLESGQAVLKVPVADFGGGSLTTSDTPVALVRNSSNTTGIVSCTVIEE